MKKYRKLLVYLLGYLILTILLAVFQPLWDPVGQTNPPDESVRFLIPQYIYAHGEIPTGLEEEIRIPGYGFSYALYNAFPYIVMGMVMRLIGLFTSDTYALLLATRFVNVLAGLGMAYVVYCLSGMLFQTERNRWLFCLLVTFQPMNIFVHSYVNTDSFCMLSTAMITYGTVRMIRIKSDLKGSVVLAAGISLCALSYYNGYGFILAAIILFFACLFRKAGERSLPGEFCFDKTCLWKYGGLITATVLLGSGWWFIRTAIVLNGDFLGLRTREEMVVAYGLPQFQYAETFAGRGSSFFEMIVQMIQNRLPVRMTESLIAAYGMLNIRPGRWFYALYLLIWGTGTAGAVFLLVQCLRDRKNPIGWQKWIFHGCMLLCIVMPLILYLRYCYTIDYQEQGRYLLPALIPAMMYVSMGLGRFNKWVVRSSMAVVVFCAVWQVFAVALPAFGVL